MDDCYLTYWTITDHSCVMLPHQENVRRARLFLVSVNMWLSIEILGPMVNSIL